MSHEISRNLYNHIYLSWKRLPQLIYDQSSVRDDESYDCHINVESVVPVDEKLTKVKVLQHLRKILDVVSPINVLPYLFEKGIISLNEYDEISDRRACCKQLMLVLYRQDPNVDAFFHLKVALRDCYKNIFGGNTNRQYLSKDGNGEQRNEGNTSQARISV